MQALLKIALSILAILMACAGYGRQLPGKGAYKQIDSLNALAVARFQKPDYMAAQRLFMLSLAEAKTSAYKMGEGTACIGLSKTSYATRDFISAEAYGKQAVDLFSQQDADILLAKAWSAWAQAVWAQSRFNEALTGFDKARQLFELHKDTALAGNIYSMMAMAEEERGNYEKSFQYSTNAMHYKDESAFIAIGQLYADVGDYDASKEYYGKVSDSGLFVLNYIKVGETYFLQKKYDSALLYYQRFLTFVNSVDKKTVSKPYLLIGELYLVEKKFDSSFYYLQNALDGFKAANDRNWVMRSLLELGKAYKEINQPQKALVYARELLANAETTGARQYARDAHYLMYELFGASNKMDSAYVHLKQYSILNNAIGIDVSARNLAFFKASAQLEQAGLKIDLLNRQKQLQDEEIRQAHQQKLYLLLGVAVLAIMFIILGRNFFLKKRSAEHLRRLAENELEIEKLQHTKKLSELEMQVLRVQMNPHFIFNSLNSINRFILRNNKADASEYLTKF
jgi:tetratricopeptide (TPR) repeat protein